MDLTIGRFWTVGLVRLHGLLQVGQVGEMMRYVASCFVAAMLGAGAWETSNCL